MELSAERESLLAPHDNGSEASLALSRERLSQEMFFKQFECTGE